MSDFGTTENGEHVRVFEIAQAPLCVRVSELGATILSVVVDGVDVVCGFDSLEGYTGTDNAYLGATVGRFANRLANASFELDGQVWPVKANAGAHQLHGGVCG